MAINPINGEHICIGLAIGEACNACKRKYPHLLARTPEQIAAGIRHLQDAIKAFEGAIDGTNPRSDEDLNDYLYQRVSD